MDGSRYGFYLRRGEQATKWVFEMQGGGWCYNEGACYGRTLPGYGGGVFGSSKAWPPTFSGSAVESANATLNPDFHGWNHVFLRYCSGASFTGYRPEPWDASGWPIPGLPGKVVPNGTSLYFRGAKNVEETVRELQRSFGMGPVDELIVTGGSAGGLATILNVDRIAALTGAKRAVGLPNAGFFKYEANHTVEAYSPSANYSAAMEYVYDMVNASGALSTACQRNQTRVAVAVGGVRTTAPRNPSPGPWNCIMAATAERFVQSPLFILQSKFDHFQLNAIAGLACMNPAQQGEPYAPPWVKPTCSAADVSTIRAYGADFMTELQHVLAGSEQHRGLFLSSCIIHGQSAPAAWIRTKVGGATPQQAFSSWYSGGEASRAVRGKWVEDCPLPCNINALACAPFQ